MHAHTHMAVPPSTMTCYGLSVHADGSHNARMLQRAVDRQGLVSVRCPGVFNISDTILISSNTHLDFAEGVSLRKTAGHGRHEFAHVLLNRGAQQRTTDENITVSGLKLIVNGIDAKDFVHPAVHGLRGHIAFLRVRRLTVRGFRYLDLQGGGSEQFALQVCTFEQLMIENVELRGRKDGVHLGRVSRVDFQGAFECCCRPMMCSL